MSDYWMSGVVESDREEARDADRYDTTEYVRVAGTWRDADDVPAIEDTL